MLKQSSRRLRLFGQAPRVFPFPKPFYDTPFDEDHVRLDYRVNFLKNLPKYPSWMEKGIDGTGRGIGLHRTHPLSPLQGNVKRGKRDVPRVFQMIAQGVLHKSGRQLYARQSGTAPNPSQHPYLTGEPCPVYGWKITDPSAIRPFEMPLIQDKTKYRPYVALQEKRIAESGQVVKRAGGAPPPETAPEKKTKPLIKRLFFWR